MKVFRKIISWVEGFFLFEIVLLKNQQGLAKVSFRNMLSGNLEGDGIQTVDVWCQPTTAQPYVPKELPKKPFSLQVHVG